MKISLSLPLVEDRSNRDPFAPTYALAAAAEAAGFDGAFIGHHHFTPGYATAPFVVLAAIAARTSTLRLGTSIMLLPAAHPLRVAEEVATLDRLSNGRVTLGVGIGYRAYEYDAFGVNYRQRASRMAEMIEVMKKVWTTEHTSHDGRYFRFDDITVYPRAVQDPHPPIWVGAVAKAAQERAARLGDGWMSDLMEPLPREVQLTERYRSFCADAGTEPTVCILRTAAIAEHREDLEHTWLPKMVAWQLDYWRNGARGRDDGNVFGRLDAGESVSIEEFARDRLIAGDPDDCIAEIARWHEALAPDHLLLSLGGADESPAGLRRAIELFGREVIPAL
ncbi:MAG: LLM class flavin-dependent oxidoreductase [Acidimicrobiia bacterium]